jgi:glucose-6-phosphate isomerase
MGISGTPGTELPAWRELSRHRDAFTGAELRELFARDPSRGDRLAAAAAGLHLDYSKNLVSDETLTLLRALADARDLRARIDGMFRGEKQNVTEDRAVLHVALRAATSCPTCTRCSSAWHSSASVCVPGSGRATRGAASAAS